MKEKENEKLCMWMLRKLGIELVWNGYLGCNYFQSKDAKIYMHAWGASRKAVAVPKGFNECLDRLLDTIVYFKRIMPTMMIENPFFGKTLEEVIVEFDLEDNGENA